MQHNEKTEAVFRYYVDRLSGQIGRTQLLKLVYLTDLEARKYLGRALTTLRYIWHYHGPFDSAFYDIMNSLSHRGFVREREVPFPSGIGYRYRSLDPLEELPFSEAERAILEFVLEQYGRQDLQDLLEDVVYDTKPMKVAQEQGKRGALLDMDLVNDQATFELGGVRLADILNGLRQGQRGQTVTLKELRRELRGSDSERRR